MRKIVSLLLSILLLLSVPFCVSANTFRYEDPESGIILQIPNGWKISSAEDCIRFESASTTATMTYRFEDLWDGLSRSERQQITRREFNNDFMSKADVADLVDARSRDVKTIKLDGTEYFSVTTSTTKVFLIYEFTKQITSFIHIENGYMHLFQFEGSKNHSDYPEFEDLVASAEYPDEDYNDDYNFQEETTSHITNSDIYYYAVNAYESGRYSEASYMFDRIPNYLDSQDYLRLIRIRSFGGNSGIGVVYDHSKALTDYMKAEISKAAEKFYFADTAQVLLCNSDVASYYLYGQWFTAPNSPVYAYFKMNSDPVGGYGYTRSSNLSNAVSNSVSINNGDIRVSITSSNDLVFHIDLLGPDCMQIYSYEYGKSFTLYRS